MALQELAAAILDRESTPVRLPPDLFKRVVELTPLVSIDLVVRDESGRMLVGLRANRPAQGYWFVPGGRVGKNETLREAFDRLTGAELGVALPMRPMVGYLRKV